MTPALSRVPALCLCAALSACAPSCGPTQAPPTPEAVRPAGPRPHWDGAPVVRTGQQVLALDRMPARYTLPDRNVPEEEVPPSTHVLTELGHLERTGRTWATHALPFRLPDSQRRFRPRGMKVWLDGEPAEFLALRMSPASGPVWRIEDDEIWGHLPGRQVQEIRIHNPAVSEDARRLSWASAREDGLTPEQFVHFGVTHGNESRDGLVLPAPATAVWSDLTVPPGAHFETALTLAPGPGALRSDGATIILSLRTAEGEVELGRTALPARASTFSAWRVDLADHAGARGDLVLQTLPGRSTLGDYVFLGAPAVVGRPDGDVRRVIVVGIDTLRPDHLGLYGYPLPTSPELDAWSRDAVIFDRAWTTAPRTRPSFRSSTTGRLPLPAVCAPTLGSVFDRAGFATAGIVANVHLNARFGFHEGYDYWTVDASAKAPQQVGLARDWLRTHADRDAFLFLHLMDPHLFYVAPPRYEDRFTSALPALSSDADLPRQYNREMIYRWMGAGELSPLARRHVVARYDGEIAFTSALLGELLQEIDGLPGATTVVIHSDHGEELWDHGGFEHNHTLYEEVTRGVLVISPPGGTGAVGARTPALSTLQDIAPTLYELYGLQDTPPTDGVSLVPALRGEPMDPERAIPIGYLKWEADRWGVVWKGHKYVLWTGSGEEELYDLEADPGEQHDLAGEQDTSPWWQQLGPAHQVDAGPGWRIDVSGRPGGTVRLTLPADALAAGVLDPEHVTSRPVNAVWGETPPVLPEDVGEVTLHSPREVELVFGRHARGIVWIRFAGPVPVDGAVARVGERELSLEPGPNSLGGANLGVRPGIVIVPPTDEAERMAACSDGGDVPAPEHGDHATPSEPEASREELERIQLCELGYAEGEACEDLCRRGLLRAEVCEARRAPAP